MGSESGTSPLNLLSSRTGPGLIHSSLKSAVTAPPATTVTLLSTGSMSWPSTRTT